MLASILSLGLLGIEGFVVTTEVNLAPGMPAFDVVGLPDAAVKESRERVRAALRNCGHAFPNGRLIVNLAPADQKKEGPAFDLPIALGVLACAGEIDPEALGEAAVLGELSLDGAVRGVRGALPMVISALEAGVKRVMLPEANANEVRCVEGIEILGASSDHTIVDIEDAEKDYQVGDIMEFDICYATLVFLTNCRNVRIVYV